MPYSLGTKASMHGPALRQQIAKSKRDAIIDLCDTPPPTFRAIYPLKDISVMSFFGFDTNLPRDRQPGQQTRGIFENTDPFAEVARAQAQGLSIDDDA